MSSPVGEAHINTIDGLLELIANPEVKYLNQVETSLENLDWMCRTILKEIDDYPEDKQGRWVGFVQGVLAMRGIMSVQLERDRTRPFFHKAYLATGQKIPETRSLPDD